MNRRTYLAACVTAVLGSAGCSQRIPPGGESGTNPVTGTEFTEVVSREDLQPYADAEYATAEFEHDDARVVVVGAIGGGSGCKFHPKLDDWSWDTESKVLEATITTVTEQKDVCPSVARPPVHYELTVQFEEHSLPETVRVIHRKGGVEVHTVTVENLHA